MLRVYFKNKSHNKKFSCHRNKKFLEIFMSELSRQQTIENFDNRYLSERIEFTKIKKWSHQSLDIYNGIYLYLKKKNISWTRIYKTKFRRMLQSTISGGEIENEE